ncbi:preprotein translocase subunit SecF [Bathymodiolus platifrons methanotrophic gill symbiont]|uniref:protein translocase subunit SecF n=1 Tax=Bathymodiolus platifrons methanotrophic gill symbiont TaxID=113268 RepID=UPI0011C78F74|nr:protein translocase subunit SecF [Bathymodiolus platifrons methanotrophic gill symbiont]MCK5870452.1 protein translocase subunit SecF [Methyloprofundus sp.]TXK96742.1 protein translocase subunit SecF [Methylococcaceae bacterium CS4]TXK98640.1 protein translocase subunit SecF [Methylococcaceae bacterium HT1]TXL01094.1 protein translocase subunit SecF [Methylococcaceae bacterium CS5]TXL04529.1 protein translocase subunit SecF [Methylococcaceae bacterium CS3]TXL04913.1 protein translocase sub
MLKQIDFLGKRKLAAMLSGLLLIIAIVSLAAQGLKLGIDFTGGTLVEIGYKQSVDLKVMRAALETAGFDDASVQHFGSSQEVLIRLQPREGLSNAQLSTEVAAAASSAMAVQGDLRRVEFVGPQVGDELTEDGGLALLYSMFGILIYVAWRFEYKFALGSVAALAHDVMITLGFFSIFQLEFDLTVLAAVLAVIGYSLNDTIVVYDRIRENFRMLRKGSPEQVMNTSLNQTLSRTLMTSLTTLLVLVALALLGGEIIHNFAVALIIGVVIGTYSSIFVASPLVLILGVSKEDLMEPEIEGEDVDMMP